MIEVLFGDSAAGAMKCALRKGSKLGTDVICLGFGLDVGDIQKAVTSEYRADLLYNMLYQKQWGADAEMKKELKQIGDVYCAEFKRLKRHLQNGERIRVWYSAAPYSVCGLKWLCSGLLRYENAVFAVEQPPLVVKKDCAVAYSGWGEVEPDEFEELLSFERELSRLEIKSHAADWERLKAENAPLRAVVNGSVIGVPANFYDFLIWKYLADEPIKEAVLIGRILGENRLGISDWYYSMRIDKMIAENRIIVIENSPRKYDRIIAKNR